MEFEGGWSIFWSLGSYSLMAATPTDHPAGWHEFASLKTNLVMQPLRERGPHAGKKLHPQPRGLGDEVEGAPDRTIEGRTSQACGLKALGYDSLEMISYASLQRGVRFG